MLKWPVICKALTKSIPEFNDLKVTHTSFMQTILLAEVKNLTISLDEN